MKTIRFFLLGLVVAFNAAAEQKLPNILWITSEDNGPELGCYGDKYSKSPNLDGLALHHLGMDMIHIRVVDVDGV